MAHDENKKVARRYLELFSEGDLTRLDEVVARDVVVHYVPSGQPTGLDGLRQALSGIRSSFPDMRFTIDDIIAEGDLVVVRGTARGTHRGEYMGIRPTGKQVSFPVIAIYRISGGKIVERWNISDDASLMRQIGAVPKAA